MDVAAATPHQILAIPASDPERLFTGPSVLVGEYRALAKRFHPDAPGGGDAAVFQHLSELYRAARARVADWRTPGLLELTGTDGRLRRVRYAKDYDLGLGRGYIGQTFVTYVLSNDYADLAKTAQQTTSSFKFPTEEMAVGLKLRLPTVKSHFHATVGAVVTVLEKPQDVVRLRDAVDTCGGTLDPRHVAWIVSELLNVACWLEWSGLTHNDLSMDSVFICPARHSACLLGGWWYSAPTGARLARVQAARTVSYMPGAVRASKLAAASTDLELVRLTAREALGDPTGAALRANKAIPAPLVQWLRTATSGSAKRDYREWQDVLTASFGPRRFVKLDLDPRDVYKTGA